MEIQIVWLGSREQEQRPSPEILHGTFGENKLAIGRRFSGSESIKRND